MTRKSFGPIAVFSLAIIILVGTLAVSEVRGDYTITVNGNSAEVAINTVFQENMTIGVLPNYTLTLSGMNASSAESIFNNAINELAPSVKVSSLEIQSASSGNSIDTKADLILGGIAQTSQGSMKFDMAWKSFKITDDIRAANQSLNLVGNYLASSPFLGRASSTVQTWGYYDDGQQISGLASARVASSFSVFDFSPLSSPLSSWPTTWSAVNRTTEWTNSFGQNMTIVEAIQGPGGTPETTTFLASYSNNVIITIPGIAEVSGDTVFLGPVPTTAEAFLPFIVVFPLAGVTAYLVDWKLTKSYKPMRRKKRKH
jgi:hypothetical protein